MGWTLLRPRVGIGVIALVTALCAPVCYWATDVTTSVSFDLLVPVCVGM